VEELARRYHKTPHPDYLPGYRNPNLYWPPDVLYRAVEEYKREAQMRLPLKQAAYDVAHNGTRYGRGGHRPPRR
jgi:hypothetical protein